jgi:hypothetical protein
MGARKYFWVAKYENSLLHKITNRPWHAHLRSLRRDRPVDESLAGGVRECTRDTGGQETFLSSENKSER